MNGQELPTEDKYRLEQQFHNTRNKVIRTNLTFLTVFAASLYFLTISQDQNFLGGLISLWVLGGLVLFWFNRKYWRCPSCSQRWKAPHILTSHYWEFCPICGTSLKRITNRYRQGMGEVQRLEEIKTKFKKNQKVRNAIASTVIPIIFILWGVLNRYNLPVEGLGLIAITVGIILLVTYYYFSKCPNCNKGLIFSTDGYCTQCGVHLKE